jgi:phosphatidylglycerol lysyltransferase
MILAILVTAAVTNTLAHPISVAMLDRWGFGVDQIRDGRFYHLLFAPFQVLRPYMAITISATILFFVGACEYRLGTWRAMVSFGMGHIVGYVGGGLFLMLLERMGWAWPMGATLMSDVGASNGAFGAAGTSIVFLGGRARRIAFVLVTAYLLAGLLFERKIWDIEHVFAFVSGLAVGRIYLRQMDRRWPGLLPPWRLEKRQRPVVLSWALRVVGTVNIMAAFLLPHHAGFARLEAWLPLGSPHWPRHLLLVTGLVLITLAPGLARRQRAAWWGTLCTLALSLVLQLHVGISLVEAVLDGAFVVLLLMWRRDFRAPAHPPSVRSGLGLLVSLAILVPLYGLIGFFILRSRFEPPVTVSSAFVETFSRVFFFPSQITVASGRPAVWFLHSIPLVAWLGVVYAIARLVRASLAPAVSSGDLDIARQLLLKFGNTGTSYMTLWEGNSLFFGPNQQCYVAYRVNSGVAIALGDPVGTPEARGKTISDFGLYADDHGWIPVFYATSAKLLDDYREAGYETLQIGEEAVIRLPGLEFHGKEWQNVRSAINRANRTGMMFRMFEGGGIPPEIRTQLFEISDEWSGQHELPTMGFTLGKTEDVDDPNVNVAIAVDASGRVHAFVDWLPVYGRHGWVIDLMKRRKDAMSGVMDFLIGTSLVTFSARGYDTASLATAPLADLDRGETTSLVRWVLSKVYETSGTYYDFRSLFQYKGKFRPNWESIYLVHRGLSTLPGVATALVRAYLPDLGLVEATKLLGDSAARLLFPRNGPVD